MIARGWLLSAKNDTIKEIDVKVDAFGADDDEESALVREAYNFACDLDLLMIMEE